MILLTQAVMGDPEEMEEALPEEELDEGRMASSAFSHSVLMFQPDLMYENLVKDYKLAKKIYGEKIIRYVTDNEPATVEKNIRLPEYRRELKKKINQKVKDLKDKNFLGKKNELTDHAAKLASLALYVDELEKLYPKGLGEKEKNKASKLGEPAFVRQYSRDDRYRDISVRRTVKTAIRRKHTGIAREDMRVVSRIEKGRIQVVFALDSSGSMKGEKIESCKRAGIALAYKAIDEKDYVGLLVFGKKIEKEVFPTRDFGHLLAEMATIRAQSQTDIANAILKSLRMFPNPDVTRHLVLITDAMPTRGEEPEEETIKAVEKARNHGVTISLIGIELKNEELAERIVEAGGGRLYIVSDASDVDIVVLEDYYSIARLK